VHKTKFTLHLEDETATLALGTRIADVLTPGLTIWLYGDLGAGKTTLSRGLLRGLGFEGKVKSPTYTLVEPYVISGLNLYHFDLYRFVDPEEWDSAGFREFFNPHAVCLVEWPEKAAGLLPAPDIEIRLAIDGAGRTASLSSHSEQGALCVERLSH
jgi:tRNA threonylcarbamoyladenosine biosynthesis protein TsaE